MPEPTIAGKAPDIIALEPGKYAWCSCGLSSKQPFCDGAHAGTEFVPKVFKIESKRTCAMCLCKHTKDAHGFCDGSHANL